GVKLRFQRAEGVVDIARPARPTMALHARAPRPAQQKHPSVWAVERFPVCERFLPHQVVPVVQDGPRAAAQPDPRGWPLSAVEPPPLHAELAEVPVLPPPPLPDLALGEVEISLPFLISGRRPGPRWRLRVPRVEQIFLPLGFGIERRVWVQHGILMRDG